MGGNTFDFMEEAGLQVVVPYDTDFNVENWKACIASGSQDEQAEAKESHPLSALLSIPSRSTLYFDEQLNALVVLKTPRGLEELQPHLSYVKINLEVQAFGSEGRSTNTKSTDGQLAQSHSKDVIWSGVVNPDTPPVIINDGNHSAFVWSVGCFLSMLAQSKSLRGLAHRCSGRPRVRMQHPMISFKASGTFRKPPTAIVPNPRDNLLPSGVPASINVLEPLGGDPELQGITPQLTAFRLDRIGTSALPGPTEQYIRSMPQNPIPALPAISARLRYSKCSASSARLSTIASLDIETSPFQDEEVKLTDVKLQLATGSVEDLCAGHAINLPKTCQPRENIVFIFRLVADNDKSFESRANPLSRILEVWIGARVSKCNQCRPMVQMRWRTTVEFSTALNPSYGGSSQAIQRSSRPSSLPLAPDTVADSDTKSQQRAMAISGIEVTMTLTGPREVCVGQPFTWDVFLVNRSDKARKLAILVIPKRKAGDHQSHTSRASGSSAVVGQRRGIDHADAVLNENRLYGMQKSNSKDAVQIACLSTDVRIGNLNPGSCHNTELKFLPLSKGVLQLEMVRVVDVVKNETTDIRDLPEIVAEERTSDEREAS
ncbi:MAG: hypothetical protein Q9205_006951 [Flavoplaca limonia]